MRAVALLPTRSVRNIAIHPRPSPVPTESVQRVAVSRQTTSSSMVRSITPDLNLAQTRQWVPVQIECAHWNDMWSPSLTSAHNASVVSVRSVRNRVTRRAHQREVASVFPDERRVPPAAERAVRSPAPLPPGCVSVVVGVRELQTGLEGGGSARQDAREVPWTLVSEPL